MTIKNHIFNLLVQYILPDEHITDLHKRERTKEEKNQVDHKRRTAYRAGIEPTAWVPLYAGFTIESSSATSALKPEGQGFAKHRVRTRTCAMAELSILR